MSEAWTAFLEMRKAKGKRAPFTPAAEQRIRFELRRLQADGHDADEVLWQSVINGWSGVFPVKGRQVVTTSTAKAWKADEVIPQTPEQRAETARKLRELKQRMTA